MAGMTAFDKILKWYASDDKDKKEVVLTEDEEAAMIRWEFIDDLYRRHKPAISQKDIMTMTMKKFEISRRQYFYDKQNTDRFFGTFNNYDRNYLINVQVEWYRQVRSAAEANKDFKSAVKASERIDKLLRLDDKAEDNAEIQPTTLQIDLTLHGVDEGGQKIINIDHLQNLPKKQFDQVVQASNQLTPDAQEILEIINNSNKATAKDNE